MTAVVNHRYLYDFTMDLGVFGNASFYFIDTSLLVYGYGGETRWSVTAKNMPKNFAKYSLFNLYIERGFLKRRIPSSDNLPRSRRN
jgi:hypothetical protein